MTNRARTIDIIREATGKPPTDLQHAMLLVAKEGAAWPKPLEVARDAEEARRDLRAALLTLKRVERIHLRRVPPGLGSMSAASEALAAMERMNELLTRVAERARTNAQQLDAFEGKRVSAARPRDWRAYMLAFHAAQIFVALTGKVPKPSKSKRDPYLSMLTKLLSHFEISVSNPAQIARWALEAVAEDKSQQ